MFSLACILTNTVECIFTAMFYSCIHLLFSNTSKKTSCIQTKHHTFESARCCVIFFYEKLKSLVYIYQYFGKIEKDLVIYMYNII